ncbi:MAG TPA: hypothetical protein EYP48_01195 [Ignisphaera sp.]|nr:hypothetical protein [Ignisphaera sp.]
MPKLVIGFRAGREVVELMNKASKRVWVCTPYIGQRYIEFLALNKRRGLDVRILIRKCIENRVVIEKARTLGLELRLLENLHAKIYIIDNQCIVGSLNLTESGIEYNIELMLVIDKESDSELFDSLEKAFQLLWTISQPIS